MCARTARGRGRYLGQDSLAASAFDGVIEAKDDDTAGDAHRHEEPEEQPTGGERRPDGAIEDTMIRLKAGPVLRPIIRRMPTVRPEQGWRRS